jgi:hypothetical protein
MDNRNLCGQDYVLWCESMPRLWAWFHWRCHGRPYYRVQMGPEWMKNAGFPQPELGYFDVLPWKYSSTMRQLNERALRELERRALGHE